jgi:hypothetical protein
MIIAMDGAEEIPEPVSNPAVPARRVGGGQVRTPSRRADTDERTGMNTQALRQHFTGTVHLPGEPGYDANRRSLNPSVDSRPALMVEAAGVADVRAAVALARRFDLPLSVQATGHGTHAPNDGGILVRTGAMAATLVDPDRRIARVGPGAR